MRACSLILLWIGFALKVWSKYARAFNVRSSFENILQLLLADIHFASLSLCLSHSLNYSLLIDAFQLRSSHEQRCREETEIGNLIE